MVGRSIKRTQTKSLLLSRHLKPNDSVLSYPSYVWASRRHLCWLSSIKMNVNISSSCYLLEYYRWDELSFDNKNMRCWESRKRNMRETWCKEIEKKHEEHDVTNMNAKINLKRVKLKEQVKTDPLETKMWEGKEGKHIKRRMVTITSAKAILFLSRSV